MKQTGLPAIHNEVSAMNAWYPSVTLEDVKS